MTEEKDRDSPSTSKKLVSPTQVVGGALASVTAAYLGSHLGVAGTFWGAGLTSVIISVGGAVYQRSLEQTKEKAAVAAAKTALTRAKRQSVATALRSVPRKPDVEARSKVKLSTEDLDRLRQARSRSDMVPVAADLTHQVTLKIHPVPNAVRPGMHWPDGEHVVDDPHAANPSEPTIPIHRDDGPSESEEPSPTAVSPSAATKLIEKDAPSASAPKRIRWTIVGGTSALVFVVCMLLITGFEEVTGKPLSGGQRGTSLGQVFRPPPPVTPIQPAEPLTTTPEQSPSQVQPTMTAQPSQPPLVEPPSQTPQLPSQPPASQQFAPTAPPTTQTTSSTAQFAPESGTLFPGQ